MDRGRFPDSRKGLAQATSAPGSGDGLCIFSARDEPFGEKSLAASAPSVEQRTTFEKASRVQFWVDLLRALVRLRGAPGHGVTARRSSFCSCIMRTPCSL